MADMFMVRLEQNAMSEPLTPTELEEFKERANRIPWEHCIFTGHEMKRVLDERDALEHRCANWESLYEVSNKERDTLRAQLEAQKEKTCKWRMKTIEETAKLQNMAIEYGETKGLLQREREENAALRARCEQLEQAVQVQHAQNEKLRADLAALSEPTTESALEANGKAPVR